MSSIAISELPNASAVSGAEVLPLVQSGVTSKIALNALRIYSDDVEDLADTNPGVSVVRHLLGRLTSGDGGEGTFRWDASDLSAMVTADPQCGVYVPPSSDPTGASGAWVRQCVVPVSVGWFGASPSATAAANTTAINAAIAFVGATLGGGELLVPAGLFLVSLAPGDYSADPATERVTALVCPYDNVHIVGAGIGATEIKCEGTAGAYGIISFLELPLENGVTKIYNSDISRMTLNGNRDSTSDPTHDCPIIRCAGLSGSEFHTLSIINGGHYGIGFQNGGYIDVSVHDVNIENTGADAIDVKDNGSISRAFRFDSIRIRNFGRRTDIADAYAGLDIYSLAPEVNNLDVEWGADGTPECGLRLKWGKATSTHGPSPEHAQLSNIHIRQTAVGAWTTTRGLRIDAPFVTGRNIHVRGVSDSALFVEQAYCDFDGLVFRDCACGIETSPASQPTEQVYAGADYCNFDGVVCIDCTTGVLEQRIGNRYSGLTLVNCTTGFDQDGVSVSGTVIRDVTFDTCATPWSLSGTQHSISGVKGATGPYQDTLLVAGSPDVAAYYANATHRFFKGYTGDPSAATEVIRFTGASANSEISAQGAAAVDLTLTPKGVGKVRFGTVAAVTTEVLSGYIEIKDSAGNIVKLAVVSIP